MKQKSQKEIQQPIGFHSVCYYSLSGNDYIEENRHFNLTAKTYEGIVNKITKVYEDQYANDNNEHVFDELKAYDTWRKVQFIYKFSAAYTFGPKVQYEITIYPIYELKD